VTRFLHKAGAAAGLPHIHPHQLRHTLATQAINRGMPLEAIAAMLGHRSMDMTLRYAKIAKIANHLRTSDGPGLSEERCKWLVTPTSGWRGGVTDDRNTGGREPIED
jgi:hypothetical protein